MLMPTPGKDESKDDFISRCIPIVIREGTAKDKAQAAAICFSMWKEHLKKQDHERDFLEFTFDMIQLCPCQTSADGKETHYEEVTIEMDGVEHKFLKATAVAVIGDRFMKNVFVSYDELNKSLDSWNGTLHDINHMGTSYPDPVYGTRPNIEYFIGFQKNARIVDKKLYVDVYINKESPKFQTWKNYMDINKASGKTPNVSMSVWASTKYVKAKDLPNGSNHYGLTDNDTVQYMHNIRPRALTTGFEGVCSDRDGCGIGMKTESLVIDSCNCTVKDTDTKTCECAENKDTQIPEIKKEESPCEKAYRDKLIKLKKELEGGNK